MTSRLRLVIPCLFEPHMIQTLTAEGRECLDSLRNKLCRASQTAGPIKNLYADHYGLGTEHLEYVPWLMANQQPTNLLRADPVILEPTHNGIVCRGNAILHLDPGEQAEIEALFNDHFRDRGLVLSFLTPSTAVVDIGDQAAAEFSPLNQVLGQDISFHLPAGEAGPEWQTILMETQMLLHRAESNRLRQEAGDKPISSLWFWGRLEQPGAVEKPQADQFYSSHPVHRAAFELPDSDLPDLPDLLSQSGTVECHLNDLDEACMQNDIDLWTNSLLSYYQRYLQPAMTAVESGTLKQFELITEQSSHRYRPWHRFRFWRKA